MGLSEHWKLSFIAAFCPVSCVEQPELLILRVFMFSLGYSASRFLQMLTQTGALFPRSPQQAPFAPARNRVNRKNSFAVYC